MRPAFLKNLPIPERELVPNPAMNPSSLHHKRDACTDAESMLRSSVAPEYSFNPCLLQPIQLSSAIEKVRLFSAQAFEFDSDFTYR